jgi:NTE family protein
VRQTAAQPAGRAGEGRPDAGYRRRIALFVESLQRRLSAGDPGSEAEGAEEQDVFDLVSKSLETMQNSIARFQLAAYSPDITIDVPRDVCSFYEFHRAREVIRIGWERAEATLGGEDRGGG